MSDEINGELKKIALAWESSKSAQNELDSKLEKGLGGIAEIKAKQDKIDKDLDAALAMKEGLEETKTAVARMASALEEKQEKSGVNVEHLNSGMKKWLKSGMPDRLDGLGLHADEVKAMQSNIDPQGGYTIQPFFGGAESILFDTSPIRSLATVQTIGTDEYVGYLDDDEFAANWVGEISPRSETDTADLGEFRIPVREMNARFTISQRLLEDSSFNLESWSQGKVSDKFNRIEATAFVAGSGAVQPQGLITGTQKTSNQDVYTRGQIGTLTTAGATAITSDELVTLAEKLKVGYLSNAHYFFNRATRAYVRKLKDGDGNYLWQPSYQFGTPDELNGQRVVVFEDMPSIATGAIAVGFGDIRAAYRIVDRVGTSVLKDPYTQGANGKVLFNIRKRVGAGLQNFDALKYLLQA